MFKVGDIIEPLPCTNYHYNITSEKNKWIGRVCVVDEALIYVKTIECKEHAWNDGHWVHAEHFKLRETPFKNFINSLAERKTVERERND